MDNDIDLINYFLNSEFQVNRACCIELYNTVLYCICIYYHLSVICMFIRCHIGLWPSGLLNKLN